MIQRRRKGAAIVDTSKGILVVAGRNKKFTLPGGGAERWETRKKAAIRELYEETGLKTKSIKFLFSYVGKIWRTHSGRQVKNYTKIFLIETYGEAKPNHEIKHIAYWKPKSHIYITNGTRKTIEKYFLGVD